MVGPAAAGGAAAEPSGGSPEASLSFSGPTGSLLISPVSPSASTRDSLDATRARNADARDLRPSRSCRSCSRDPTRAPIRTAVLASSSSSPAPSRPSARRRRLNCSLCASGRSSIGGASSFPATMRVVIR